MSDNIRSSSKPQRGQNIVLLLESVEQLEANIKNHPTDSKKIQEIHERCLQAASAYHSNKQTLQSLAMVEKAIQWKPSARDAYDLLLQVHESNTSLDIAANVLRMSISRNPRLAVLHCLLAEAYQKMGWWIEARDAAQVAHHLNKTMREPQEILSEAAKYIKDTPEYFLEVGEACEKKGELRRAENAYHKALDLQAGHPQATAWLERTQLPKPPPSRRGITYTATQLEQAMKGYYDRDDAQGALDFILSYHKSYANYIPAFSLLADAYRKIGRMGEAAQTLFELGNLYLQQGDVREALETFEQALEHRPYYPDASKKRNELINRSAPPSTAKQVWDKFDAAGRYEEAKKYFENQVLLTQSSDAYLCLGYAHERLDNISEAYEALKRGVERLGTPTAYLELGNFCVHHELYDQAKEAYEKIRLKSAEAQYWLEQIPSLIKSQQERLESRPEKEHPDFPKYLGAIWKLCKEQRLFGEAAKYLNALASAMPDEPLLFKWLGQAQESTNLQAAALAYRHAADLWGTAKDYFRLSRFCAMHGLAAMANETSIASLELNPFFRQDLRPLVTGDEDCEDLARDLCENPSIIPKSDELRNRFHAARKWEEAERTYQRLLVFHPEHPVFTRDLAMVHLRRGKPEQAWLVAQKALHRSGARDKIKVELASLVTQAERRMAQQGKKPPLLSDGLTEAIKEIAIEIRYDWRQVTVDVEVSDSPIKLVEHALEYRRRADEQKKHVTNIAQLDDFLRAARLFELAERAASQKGKHEYDIIRCLVTYGRAKADWLRHHLKSEQDKDSSKHTKYAIEAMRLAVFRVPGFPAKQIALLSYLRDYFADMMEGWAVEKGFGSPRTWQDPEILSESLAVLDEARLRASPHVANVLGQMKQLISSAQQPTSAEDFQNPVYCRAVVECRIRSLLRPSEQEIARELLKRLTVGLPMVVPRAEDRGRVEITPPTSQVPLPCGTGECDLSVSIRNTREVPIDCIKVTLNVSFADQTYEQSIPFLPGRKPHVFGFHLSSIPPKTQYVESNINLTYFDPIKPCQQSIQSDFTLRRADQAFKIIRNPYERLRTLREYWNEEQTAKLLVEPGQSAGIEWQPKALKYALEITGGEAATMGMLAQQVVKYLNQVERTEVVLKDIDRAVSMLMNKRNGLPHFLALTEGDELSAVDKLILSCTAANPNVEQTGITQEELIKAVKDWYKDLTPSGLRSRLRRMQSEIPLVDSQDNRYRLKSKLLNAWLRKYWRPEKAVANMKTSKVLAQIFLSYASEDEKKVEDLYQKLKDAKFKPWMAPKDILPGQRFNLEIERAVEESDFFILCMSRHSVNKRGWIRRELKRALFVGEGNLDADIFIIPLRLDDCEVPPDITRHNLQWIDWFKPGAWERLIKALQKGIAQRR